MATIREQIEVLAEKYRKDLGLKPWSRFEQEMLKKWDDSLSLSREAREQFKALRRQCGKTTRGLLYKIAEAVVTRKALLVCGPTVRYTDAIHYMAEDLVHRLRLDLKVIKPERQVVAYSESYEDQTIEA